MKDFGKIVPADELLHPVAIGANPGLTETSYFHFNIPSANLTGELYVWFHSRLRVISTGIWIWSGLKRDRLLAEHFDYRSFMPYHDGQIDDYVTPIGMHVKVIEPLSQIQLRYRNEERGLSFDLIQKAVAPPIPRAQAFDFEGDHESSVRGGFEQIMKVDGVLELGGTRHVVDCFSIRDRSWNQVRDEMPRDVPPYTWFSAVANENFAFCLGAYDDVARNPEWKGLLAEQPNEGMVHGWIYKDGEVRRLTRVSKITHRDNMIPLRHSLAMTDSNGESYAFEGESVSALPFTAWQNMTCWFGLTRWECDGLVAWGDCQECHWDSYVRACGS